MVFDKQKQLDLFDQYRINPSTQLRNQIAIANSGLVRKVAHRLVKQLNNVDFDDLFQVGFIGLVRSIERYNPALNTLFSSYAVPFIRGSILHYLRDTHNMVKLGRRLSNFIVPSRKAIEKLTLKLGRNPTDLEIATELKIDLQHWLDVRQGLRDSNSCTLNIFVENDGARSTELIDFIVDYAESDRSELTETLTDVVDAIEQLGWNEQRAIECYYLQNMTRKDIGIKFGVSPMTITRRLQVGIRKLRELMLQY